MSITYVGVDQGLYGAIVHIDENSNLISATDMPITDVLKKGKRKALVKSGRKVLNIPEIIRVFERVRNQQDFKCIVGIEDTFSKSARVKSMYVNSGIVIGIAHCTLGDPLIQGVHPSRWKSHFKLSKDKHDSIKLASVIFGHTFPNDGQAEAALIALYTKELYLKTTLKDN